MRVSTYMYTRIRIHVHIHVLMRTRMHIHVPGECATPCCCLLCLHCSARDDGRLVRARARAAPESTEARYSGRTDTQ